MPSEWLFIWLGALTFLIVCNLAKFSFTRLRRNPLDEVESLSESEIQRLEELYKHSSVYIHTVQFLIIASHALMGISLFGLLDTVLDLFPFVPADGPWHLVAAIVVWLLGASGVLAIGEMVPKTLALSYPEEMISWGTRITSFVGRIAWPFIKLSAGLAHLFLGKKYPKILTEIDMIYTEDEIRHMVSHSHQGGAIDKEESELIDNVFDFVNRRVKEIMIPRNEVICLYVDDSFEENIKVVAESPHSRYPLCEEDKDHVVGLIHVKDLMEHREMAMRDLRSIRRNILFVPEVMLLPDLLQQMRTQRVYQAIVVDEYGGMVGMAGLEDIVEELVGDIKDEHEKKREQIVDLGDGSFEFEGTILIDEVEHVLQTDLTDADEDTLGGFIFGLLERSPEVGDKVRASGYEFTVIELHGYRISRALVKPIEETDEEVYEES